MNNRNVLIYSLVLIVVALALAFVNFYYIQPGLKPVLAKAEITAVKAVPADLVDKNIVASTMEKIKTMFPPKKFQQDFAPRRIKRNPFFWPGEVAAAAAKRDALKDQLSAGKATVVKETKMPVVQMIIIGESRKIALIDSRFVYEGDRFNGDRVRKIDADSVLLRGDTGETRLYLAEYTFASAGQDKKQSAPSEKNLVLPGRSQQETVENLFKKLKPLLQQNQ